MKSFIITLVAFGHSVKVSYFTIISEASRMILKLKRKIKYSSGVQVGYIVAQSFKSLHQDFLDTLDDGLI